MTEPMTMRARVRAPVKAVHQALTDASHLRIWLTDHVEVDLPQRYAFWGPYIPDGAAGQPVVRLSDRDRSAHRCAYGYAEILDLVPERKVSVNFGDIGVVTWELAGSEGRTRLTLAQSGFDPTDPPYAAWAGGLSGLAELRRFHELADWQPIWSEKE